MHLKACHGVGGMVLPARDPDVFSPIGWCIRQMCWAITMYVRADGRISPEHTGRASESIAVEIVRTLFVQAELINYAENVGRGRRIAGSIADAEPR